MTKTSLSRAPGGFRRGTRRRARLIGAGFAAAALVSVLVPALGAGPAGAAGTSGAVPAIAWHRCPGGQRGRDGGRVLVRDGGGAAGLPGSVRAEDQAGGGGAPGHRPGPPRRDLLQPGRARRGRHGAAPGIYRVLPEGAAARVRHRELGPARVRREHGGPVLPERRPRKARSSASTPLFPVGRGQQRAYIRRWREFGKICAARNGALLRHVSTADSARDLNLLRQDLGQPKLNYLGISYGTFLGATYANLFPRRVGRLVLDGNVPPEAWTNGGRPNPRLSTYLRMRQRQSGRQGARRVPAHLRAAQHPGLRVLGAAAPPRPGPSGMCSWPASGGRPSPWAAPPSPTPRLSPPSASRSPSCSRSARP